jgi:DNA polymerase III delta prime subunit
VQCGLNDIALHFAGIMRRCREILVAETVEITEAELRHVVELNYPDVRQTINALQFRSGNLMQLDCRRSAQWQKTASTYFFEIASQPRTPLRGEADPDVTASLG